MKMKKKKNNELKVGTILLVLIFVALAIYRHAEFFYLELVEMEAESVSSSNENEDFEVQVASTQPAITATPLNVLSKEDISGDIDVLYNHLLTHSNEVEINTSTATDIAYVTVECVYKWLEYLEQVDFSEEDKIIALQIIYLESGCNANTYENGDEKVGIMGIPVMYCNTSENSSNPNSKKVLVEYDCTDLADPLLNLRAAYLIANQQGWESWDTYNDYELGIIESAD